MHCYTKYSRFPFKTTQRSAEMCSVSYIACLFAQNRKSFIGPKLSTISACTQSHTWMKTLNELSLPALKNHWSESWKTQYNSSTDGRTVQPALSPESNLHSINIKPCYKYNSQAGTQPKINITLTTMSFPWWWLKLSKKNVIEVSDSLRLLEVLDLPKYGIRERSMQKEHHAYWCKDADNFAILDQFDDTSTQLWETNW